jgi:hypothetical protein
MFKVEIACVDTQVKFEFGYGLLIFDRVIPLEL